MTPIPARVVNVDKLGDQYLITVLLGQEKAAHSFDRFSFGENQPQLGWYHYGWLDLSITEIPA